MIIEYGMQPNCSELVIRLPNTSVDQALVDLKTLGIEEAFIRNFYGKWRNKVGDWDDEKLDQSVTLVKDMPKRVLDLWSEKNKNDITANEITKIDEELRSLGFGIWDTVKSLIDPENGLPDLENGGSIHLEDNWEDIGVPTTAIVAHQHCQEQLFPTLMKIAAYYNAEVEANDGGSIEQYNEWLDKQYEDAPDEEI